MPDASRNAQRVAGAVLIGASVLALAAVLHHPHGDGHGADLLGNLQHISGLNRAIHGAMIVTLLLLWLSLSEYSAVRPRALVRSAWLSYSVGALAMIGAALTNGFVLSALVARAAGADAATQADILQLLPLSWAINQTLAAFGLLLMSVGIALWSLDQWRHAARAIANIGLAVAAGLGLAYLVGLLRLDIPGMIAIVLGQGLWYFATGLGLLRRTLNPT